MQQVALFNETRSEAEKLNALQSTIINNVSHELRSPLAVILGFSALLQDGAMGALVPQQQEAVVTIVTRAQQLQTIVEQIGTLMEVKMHTGTVPTALAVGEVVMAVVEERRAAATQVGLTLEAHVEPSLPLVSGNPYQLRQAVDSLVDNAIKFTPEGGRVEVRAYTEPGWVCLAVSDTGVGIGERDIERIFTPFYQVDGSTTRHYAGLGLGLSVAKSVVEAHNGRLEVKSRPGQGSRFTIKLDPSADQESQPGESEPRPRRILIVDDEEFVTVSLQAGLAKLANCQVVTANNGDQALQLLEQQPFDLMITDYKMPGVDGITLAARVRRAYPQTAIIMLTAYSDDRLRQQANSVAIRRVLDKPVQLAQVRSVALEALEGNPPAGEKNAPSNRKSCCG